MAWRSVEEYFYYVSLGERKLNFVIFLHFDFDLQFGTTSAVDLNNLVLLTGC